MDKKVDILPRAPAPNVERGFLKSAFQNSISGEGFPSPLFRSSDVSHKRFRQKFPDDTNIVLRFKHSGQVPVGDVGDLRVVHERDQVLLHFF